LRLNECKADRVRIGSDDSPLAPRGLSLFDLFDPVHAPTLSSVRGFGVIFARDDKRRDDESFIIVVVDASTED